MAPPYSDQPSLDEKLPDPPDPTFSRTDTSHSRSNKRGLARIDQKGHEQVSHKAPRVTTVYMSMFLEQSFTIEKNAFYPICAAGATWVLLAGFIVLPGTYTKFQNSEIIKAAQEDKSNFGNQILAGVAGLKILAVAIYLCGIGLVGIIALWVRWRKNYIWLINKVLLPALLNSLVGLLSTLVNVLSKDEVVWNVTAKVTTGVTGGLVLFMSAAFLYYKYYLLAAVIAAHEATPRVDEDPKKALQANGQLAV